MQTLLITRNQYDDLLGTFALMKFLKTYKFTWSLAGITFRNVTDDDFHMIAVEMRTIEDNQEWLADEN
tara:strand:+ start:1478 stop:1681 length:204 start_codon:yes stop_codon:yes gene_type:complete